MIAIIVAVINVRCTVALNFQAIFTANAIAIFSMLFLLSIYGQTSTIKKQNKEMCSQLRNYDNKIVIYYSWKYKYAYHLLISSLSNCITNGTMIAAHSYHDS